MNFHTRMTSRERCGHHAKSTQTHDAAHTGNTALACTRAAEIHPMIATPKPVRRAAAAMRNHVTGVLITGGTQPRKLGRRLGQRHDSNRDGYKAAGRQPSMPERSQPCSQRSANAAAQVRSVGVADCARWYGTMPCA